MRIYSYISPNTNPRVSACTMSCHIFDCCLGQENGEEERRRWSRGSRADLGAFIPVGWTFIYFTLWSFMMCSSYILAWTCTKVLIDPRIYRAILVPLIVFTYCHRSFLVRRCKAFEDLLSFRAKQKKGRQNSKKRTEEIWAQVLWILRCFNLVNYSLLYPDGEKEPDGYRL